MAPACAGTSKLLHVLHYPNSWTAKVFDCGISAFPECVQLLIDEQGLGKFSYSCTLKGEPRHEPAGMYATSITILPTVKQARLRFVSLTGDKCACQLGDLQCTMKAQGSSSCLAASTSGNLTKPPPSPQQGTTQLAQIQCLLQHTMQHGEGEKKNSLMSGRLPQTNLMEFLFPTSRPAHARSCAPLSTCLTNNAMKFTSKAAVDTKEHVFGPELEAV